MILRDLINYLNFKNDKKYEIIDARNADTFIYEYDKYADNTKNRNLYIVNKNFNKKNFFTDDILFEIYKNYHYAIPDELDIEKLNYINENTKFSDERLKELLPDFEKITNEIFLKSVEKGLFTIAKQEIENRKHEYNYYKGQYDAYLSNLINAAEQMEKYRYPISEKQLNEDIEKCKSEINNIVHHKKVKNIDFDGNTLIITVSNIIMFEPISERYYKLGDAIIYLPIKVGNNLYFEKTKDNKGRQGWWCKSQLHPHIDENGEACLGNASAMLAQYATQKQYYAMFITALNFLQSVNVEDEAGYAVSFWDECDKDGIIIKEGHAPVEGEYGEDIFHVDRYDAHICPICERDIYDDDRYYCEDCGREVCENCVTYVESVERYVCDDCLDELYVMCESCNEWISKENAHYVNDEWLCDDCYIDDPED